MGTVRAASPLDSGERIAFAPESAADNIMVDTLIYNLVDTETQKYTEHLDDFWYGSMILTKPFYDRFEDEVDFIFFLYVPADDEQAEIQYRDVHRPVCPALGIGGEGDWSCDHRSQLGSAGRLTAVLKIPLVMGESTPPHISREILRNWQGKLKGSTSSCGIRPGGHTTASRRSSTLTSTTSTRPRAAGERSTPWW